MIIYAYSAILSVWISQLLGDALGLKHGTPERISLIVATAAVNCTAIVIDLARGRRQRRQRELETAAAREALRTQAANYDGE